MVLARDLSCTLQFWDTETVSSIEIAFAHIILEAVEDSEALSQYQYLILMRNSEYVADSCNFLLDQ